MTTGEAQWRCRWE